jgi:hypothetical protein
VVCHVHLAVPAGALPAQGFDVYPSRSCQVLAPTFNLSAAIGSAQLTDIGMNPTTNSPFYLQMLGATTSYGNTSQGIWYWGSVTTPPGFTGTYYTDPGGWAFTQLVTPYRTVTKIDPDTNTTIQYGWVANGYEGLDRELGYLQSTMNGFPAQGGTYDSYDHPGISLSDSISASVSDSFRTYMMYVPPLTDSRPVPLKRVDWHWSGEASLNASQMWQLNPGPVGYTFSEDQPWHPEWVRRHQGGFGELVPV